MVKRTIDPSIYRKNEFFGRNQKIWGARYKGLSLKEIAKLFHLSVADVKEVLSTHRQFFEEEYN